MKSNQEYEDQFVASWEEELKKLDIKDSAAKNEKKDDEPDQKEGKQA